MDPLDAFLHALQLTRQTVNPSSSAAESLDQTIARCTDLQRSGMTPDAQWKFLEPALLVLFDAVRRQSQREHRRSLTWMAFYWLAAMAAVVTTAGLVFVLRDHPQPVFYVVIGGGMAVIACLVAMAWSADRPGKATVAVSRFAEWALSDDRGRPDIGAAV